MTSWKTYSFLLNYCDSVSSKNPEIKAPVFVPPLLVHAVCSNFDVFVWCWRLILTAFGNKARSKPPISFKSSYFGEIKGTILT